MENQITDLVETHLLTSDQKLHWWGVGEWVEEPDEVTFVYRGVKCLILRAGSDYGELGHLCGYIEVNSDHPWAKVDPFDLNLDVHEGVTYGHEQGGGVYRLGFDCAHSRDVCPSVEKMLREVKEKNKDSEWAKSAIAFEDKWKKECPRIFMKTYRNIEFCKLQCMNLVEQAIEATASS